MASESIPGVLEIDHDRGVIYFHIDPALVAEKGLVTLLRICSMPTPVPKDSFLDITVRVKGSCSWSGQ